MKVLVLAVLGSLEAASAIQCYQDLLLAVPALNAGGFMIGSTTNTAGTPTVTVEGSTCYAWESTNAGGGGLCLGTSTGDCPGYTWGSQRSCTSDLCNTARAYVGVQTGVEYFTCITDGNCESPSTTSLNQVNGAGCFQTSDAGCPAVATTTTEEPKCEFTIGGMSRSDLTCETDTCNASEGDIDTMDNQCTCEGEHCDSDELCQCFALKGGCGNPGDDEYSDSGVNGMQIGQIRELCPGSCAWVTDGEVNPKCSNELGGTTQCLLGGAAIAASSFLL